MTSPIAAIAHDDLRACIRVAGAPELFEGTLAENLRAGRDTITADDMVRALTLVELDDVFFADGKAGLQTHILPYGAVPIHMMRLLMIARAVLSNPSILAIDGALDGIEPELAVRIVRRLADLSGTLLVVTSNKAVCDTLTRRLGLAPASEPNDPDGDPSASPTKPKVELKSKKRGKKR